MKNRIIIYTFLLLGFLACNKDKVNPVDEEKCEPFDLPDPGITTFGYERFQYKAPHFNPNNSNEFIYHYRDNEQNKYHLLKYNLQTQQKTLIAVSGKIWDQPKWSSKGWIAYTHYNSYVDHIYILKDNGDSLIQFTENTANLYPAWSASGDELYWAHTPVIGGPRYFLKQLIDDEYIDTLLSPLDTYSGSSLYNEISTSNNLLSLTRINNNPYLAIASLNEESLSFTNIANMEQVFNYPNPSGLCWSHDEKYVYVSIYESGLYRVDVNSLNTVLLMEYCKKRYESLSASADGKYLIGERTDSYLETDEYDNITGTIMESSSIYLIDLQTMEETKIDLAP